MTDHERIEVIDYVRERFNTQDTTLKEIKELAVDLAARVETLESDRDHRDGRNNFINRAAKTAAGFIAAVLAALGIKSSLGL